VSEAAVRRARRDELAVLDDLACRSKAHWGYDDGLMERWRDELRVAPADVAAGRVLVATVDDTVVGFATVTGDPPDAELEAMFVDPASLAGGTGAVLFAAACDLARGLRCRRLLIESDPHAEGFYVRQGAVRIGDRTSPSVPGRTLPLLAFDL
jgi:GNAT superfamily N-acetyltransferase